MKIRTNKRIQQAVYNRQAHRFLQFVTMPVFAEEFDKDKQGGGGPRNPTDDFALGIDWGFELAVRCARRTTRRRRQPVPKDFGVYVAIQPTSAGNDLFYFIGTPDEIVRKLLTIPPTENAGPDPK